MLGKLNSIVKMLGVKWVCLCLTMRATPIMVLGLPMKQQKMTQGTKEPNSWKIWFGE